MTDKTKLLAIDPGTREFGFAEFCGADLVDQNVKSLRRCNPSQDRLKVFTRMVTKTIDDKQPDVIALEKNSFRNTASNDQLMKAIAKIKFLARARDIAVYEIAPGTAKKIATGDGWATKQAVAKAVCVFYPELRVHLNQKAEWKERYMQNMFDAVACGLAWFALKADHNLKDYEVETK